MTDITEHSILISTKKMLGIDKSYEPFDPEIVMHINGVLSTLTQLGIGPDEGFHITGDSETWTDFMGEDNRLNNVRTYVFLSVRLVFDPPNSGYGVTAIQEQLKELTWRINVTRENAKMSSI